MIEYSKQESEIFGLQFGRVILGENFVEWNELKEEIVRSRYDFIRLKIKNPRSIELDELNKLASKAHLLEILRVYRSEDLLVTPFENHHSDLVIEKVGESNKDILGKLIFDTYDDIPFGNYTPANINEIFPPDIQLKAIIAYFLEYYTGIDPEKVAYIYYNQDKKPIGCVLSDFYDNGTYSYYVGVDRDERHKGIQFKIVNYIKFYTTARNRSFLDGSTRLTNLYSARTMEKNGCKCIGYDWVYLIEK